MSKYVDAIGDPFVNQYKRKTPPWGPVGYCVYKRTYSRKVEGEDRTEEWWETVRRCCNGIIKIGGKFTDNEIKTLYDKVFNLKCSFSGRALWQLGTETVDRLGADSLQNCWSLAVTDPVEAFCFTFDELMLGGGVGFNIQREFVYEMPKVKYDVKVVRRDEKDVDFIVPDNREGWVDLLRRTLTAFYYTGKSFDYSTICVRGKGAPIKGFGGTASGPEDLCNGIEQICNILRGRVGKKLRPIDCLDIMNIIGSVVVAGNVRRSAQVALGDMDDRQYLDAKNWGKGAIPNWRSMSNNSVVCNDFKHLPSKFWSGYNGEGEPYGLINMKNCQTYGRLADGKGYRPDRNVTSVNPCAEIPLVGSSGINGQVGGESCNLAEIFLPNLAGQEEFKDVDKHLKFVKLSCDKHGKGANVTYLRQDAAESFKMIRQELHDAGAIVTSSGGRRLLSASVGPNRSQTSLHYLGIAHDLFVWSAMIDPFNDPYIVERSDDRQWTVWARATKDGPLTTNSNKIVRGYTYDHNEIDVTGRFINVTKVFEHHGWHGISARSSFFTRKNKMGAEWWHFQYEAALSPGDRFGDQLLLSNKMSKLQTYSLWNHRNVRWKKSWF